MKILDDGQIICESQDILAREEYLIAKLKEDIPGITKLPAGLLLVRANSKLPGILFQLLVDMDVASLRKASLMYVLPGSTVRVDSVSPIIYQIATVLWRDCRFPTIREYNIYKKCPVV